MREYSKIQAGKENTFENIKKDRGEEFTAVERSGKLHQEANVLTSFWRTSTTAIVRLWGQHV